MCRKSHEQAGGMLSLKYISLTPYVCIGGVLHEHCLRCVCAIIWAKHGLMHGLWGPSYHVYAYYAISFIFVHCMVLLRTADMICEDISYQARVG